MSQIRRTAGDEPFFLVRTLAAAFPAGETTVRHAHPWGQLIYASSGVITVWTETGSWVAPTHWAVWAPAGARHSIRFAAGSTLRTLYVRPDLAAELPAACGVITVSPLLRELIARAMQLGMLDERHSVDRALAALIVSEFHRSDAPPFDLPTPVSDNGRQAARMLEDDGEQTLAHVAAALGLSLRTLERQFLAETGMTLGAWRRQARLLQALQKLAAGQRVKAVAGAAGYRSPSAFVAAFREAFGATPGRYFLSGQENPAEIDEMA